MLNNDYFKKIIKIFITYLLCSIFCFIVLHFLQHTQDLSFKTFIFSVLDFTAAPYGWYVNMYLGLYLLIPFLNILWKNLNLNYKKYLILVLIIICVIPTFMNIYQFNNLLWWSNPASSTKYQTLFPNWWTGVGYPILYYFIGCYFKEYKLNIHIAIQIVFLILSMVLFGLFNFYRDMGSKFIWSVFVGYYSFETVIISTLLFSIILNGIKINLKNTAFIKFISKISYLTFGAYLLSAIFDNFYWSFLKQIPFFINHQIFLGIVAVFMIIISSLMLSYIVNLIEKAIFKMIRIMKCK